MPAAKVPAARPNAHHTDDVAAVETAPDPVAEAAAIAQVGGDEVATALFPELSAKRTRPNFLPQLSDVQRRVGRWLESLGALGTVRVGTALLGSVAVLWSLAWIAYPTLPSPWIAGIAAALCLIAAGLAAIASRYFADLDPSALPEAMGLGRGARVTAWILVVAAVSIGLEWFGLMTILRTTHFVVLAINAAVCYALLTSRWKSTDDVAVFPVNLAPFAVLGSRANIVASILGAAERQLGIDLRSTWALTVVRQGFEPLVISLFLAGWLSTSLTVVGVEENGLVERLGVPVGGQPLAPGLHLHWPWPIDRVYRLPVLRVQAISVGHEGEEAPGPENVLWSVEHAPNEFTLLLGNGRDLITIDAAVQYRITDPRAWRYSSQNPDVALRALAYRAVMRNTVNRTLSDALSENVAKLADRIRAMVQQDADSLGLGVTIVGFTVGGMHPPVAVAASYEAVVSAQISRVTAVVNAQVFRNQTLPAAEDSVLVRANAARAEGEELLARAAGEAWAFRTLESQYRVAPAEYYFRRRLETLENGLAGRNFTVVDARFLRDGGELWIVP